jgi:hypothetical protein
MQSIEEQAIETYKENLNYFFQKHPNTYKILNTLNVAIESGQYKERYALEYIDGYFDIKEINSGHFLYNSNSTALSKEVAKKVNLKKTDNVIETFYTVPLTKQRAQEIHDTKGVISDALYATSNIIYYTRNMLPKETSTFKRVEKYIYFGVGLGIHLKLIQNKLHSSKVFVIEDDVELFRLSLFTTNYKEVFKDTKVFFSIAEDVSAFKLSYNKFSSSGYNHNHYIKYTIFSDSYIDKIKNIQDIIVTSNTLSYPYSAQLMSLIKTPEYLVEGYRYLNIEKKHTNNLLTHKPVMLVAAGPSLRKNISWLKQNQDKFIIVSVLAAAQLLNEYEIKPDIVVNIDAHQIILKFFKGIDTEKFFKDTKFLFSSMVNKKVSDKIAKENQYIFEVTTNYKVDFGRIATPSVGENTYGLLLSFGAKDIYLLGLDLALDPQTKQKYANQEHEISLNKETDILNTQIGSTITNVKGNFLDSVPSISLFTSSIYAFTELSKYRKREFQNVYNLNNGAFLYGAEPLKVEDIELSKLSDLDKNSKGFRDDLKQFLDSVSEVSPNKKDLINLSQQIQEAIRLYTITQTYKERKSFNSSDSYLLHFSKFINELLALKTDDKLDINIIMYEYLQYITPYIFDFFNTNELKNHKKHTKYINKVFISQVEKMLVTYIETLKIYKLFGEKNV